MTSEPVRLGVLGLGRAFMLTLPAFRADDRVRLVAACAPRQESLDAFAAEFGGTGYQALDAFLADSEVEAVYVATPHQLHAEQVIAAARAGKHVLVDKPLAISMADGTAMVEACEAAGVNLIVGPSHSFDAPVGQARALIESGAVGRVRMIHAFNYTDFLYRPRRPEELRTEEGGGVVFSQAVHQIDVVRLLAGGLATRMTAMTGDWDPARPTEGAFSALIAFEGGAFASLTYSGYGRFDSDEWMSWVGELGHEKDPADYGKARRALARATSAEEEAALKRTRTYGAAEAPPPPPHHEQFGPVIVSCEKGDIRLTPDGIWIYADAERRFAPAPKLAHPRTPVIDALVAALRDGIQPAQTGRWGLASLELCHGILESARTGAPVDLAHQVAAGHTGHTGGRA